MPQASQVLSDRSGSGFQRALGPGTRSVPRFIGAWLGSAWWRPWVLGFAAWTLVGVFLGSRRYLAELSDGRDPGWWRTIAIWLTCYYLWAILTPPVLLLSRRFPLQPGTLLRGLAVHVPASILAALVYLGVTALVWPQIWWTAANRSSAEYFQHIFLASFHTEILTYWALVGLLQFADYYRRYRERELQTSQLKLQMSQLEASLSHAQLSALRMQLQPHFLFNTLNTISMLMQEDVEVANRMLVRLGELLRMTLETGDSHVIPLGRELAILERYLEIEQIRFPERLTVEMQVDPALLDDPVPTFLLQPLVENSIRYAIAPRAAPGVIRIGATTRGGCLVLSVSDNGPGLGKGSGQPQGQGIGLANSRARLEQLYPGEGSLEMVDVEGGGLEVRITIPALPSAAEVRS